MRILLDLGPAYLTVLVIIAVLVAMDSTAGTRSQLVLSGMSFAAVLVLCWARRHLGIAAPAPELSLRPLSSEYAPTSGRRAGLLLVANETAVPPGSPRGCAGSKAGSRPPTAIRTARTPHRGSPRRVAGARRHPRIAQMIRTVAVTALSGSTVTEVNGPTCRHAGAL